MGGSGVHCNIQRIKYGALPGLHHLVTGYHHTTESHWNLKIDKKTGRHPDSSRKSSSEHVPDTTYPVENFRLRDESRESGIENQEKPLLTKVKAKEVRG